MEFLIAWVICGLVGFLLGKVKGKEGLGFVLGLLLGPIGWIVMLCLGGSPHKCPHCQGNLPSGSVSRCMHCGSTLKRTGAKAQKAEKIRQQLAAVDPLEAWEAQQRLKEGPPAVPAHLKGKPVIDDESPNG